MATELNRILSQSEKKTRYIIAKCGDINLTDEDIISLKGKSWLTDQVMDSYIGAIAEAETDKGKKVMRIPTSTMTAIVEGNCLQNMTLKNLVKPKARQKKNFNPLGETLLQKMMIHENWSNFFNQRIATGLESTTSSIQYRNWTQHTVDHSKQLDSHNCGVFVLLFCERHFSKENLLNISPEELRVSKCI